MKRVVRLGWASMMALAAMSCGNNENTATVEEKAEKVREEQVLRQEIEREVDCTSILEGYETMNVSPSLTGIIEKRYKDVGDRVSQGEMLVRMDQTQYKQAKLAFANLTTEMKRMDALLAGGNVTQQSYDATKLQYDQAKETLEFTETNTFFKATFPGVVSARNYENGELYSGAQPILTVVQLNMLKTIINIPEAYFPKIKQGMKLDIISDIYPDQKFPATIETIYPTIDASTHTFQCKVKIPNGSMKLRPGMYIHTTVNVGKEKVLVVPYQSVLKLTGSNERYLFLDNNGRAQRVTVEMGQRYNKYVEVTAEEVAEGKLVITQGQARLTDGAKLQILTGNYEEEAAARSAGLAEDTVPSVVDTTVVAPVVTDTTKKK